MINSEARPTQLDMDTATYTIQVRSSVCVCACVCVYVCVRLGHDVLEWHRLVERQGCVLLPSPGTMERTHACLLASAITTHFVPCPTLSSSHVCSGQGQLDWLGVLGRKDAWSSHCAAERKRLFVPHTTLCPTGRKQCVGQNAKEAYIRHANI